MPPRKRLAESTGDLTVEKQQIKQLTEELTQTGMEDFAIVPDWIDGKVATDEWHRLVNHFAKIGILDNLDYNNLAHYCHNHGMLVKATKHLNKDKLTATNKKTGAVRKNPWIEIQLNYSNEVVKYSKLLGLDPNSRLKLGEVKLKDEKDKVEDEFGDI